MITELPEFQDSQNPDATVTTHADSTLHQNGQEVRRVDCRSSAGRNFQMQSIDGGDWTEVGAEEATPAAEAEAAE